MGLMFIINIVLGYAYICMGAYTTREEKGRYMLSSLTDGCLYIDIKRNEGEPREKEEEDVFSYSLAFVC